MENPHLQANPDGETPFTITNYLLSSNWMTICQSAIELQTFHFIIKIIVHSMVHLQLSQDYNRTQPLFTLWCMDMHWYENIEMCLILHNITNQLNSCSSAAFPSNVYVVNDTLNQCTLSLSHVLSLDRLISPLSSWEEKINHYLCKQKSDTLYYEYNICHYCCVF